jgi:hypothetical protein
MAPMAFPAAKPRCSLCQGLPRPLRPRFAVLSLLVITGIATLAAAIPQTALFQPPQPAPSHPAPSTTPPPDAPAPPPAVPAPAASPNSIPVPAEDEDAPADAAGGAGAGAGVGRETSVYFKDGRRFTGTLVKRAEDRVTLRIGGVDTPLSADQIDRVEILPPVMDRYRQMRRAIEPADADRLLMLAEWLRFREKYATALAEVERILTLQPDNVEAKKLRTLIVAQKALKDGAKPRPVPPSSRPESGPPLTPDDMAPKPPRPPAKPSADTFPLLTPEQINLLKVYEVDINDPPRMRIPREAIEKLIKDFAGDPLIPTTREGREALFRRPPEQILDIMFKLRARDLYPLVQVQDHPKAVQLFRDDVNRAWLHNACATDRCHGGADAGRLQLETRRSGTDASVYTNLLILDRFKLKDGTPLINYEDPKRSPLLQMGLPRDSSLYPHPLVAGQGRGAGYKTFFHSTDDTRFVQAVQWISAMYHPRPQYPIDYTPPGGKVEEAHAPR